MCFAYLANIYVFILSSVPNEFESELKMSNISPSYKIKLLLWFLFKKSLRSVGCLVGEGSIPNEHFQSYYSNPD